MNISSFHFGTNLLIQIFVHQSFSEFKFRIFVAFKWKLFYLQYVFLSSLNISSITAGSICSHSVGVTIFIHFDTLQQWNEKKTFALVSIFVFYVSFCVAVCMSIGWVDWKRDKQTTRVQWHCFNVLGEGYSNSLFSF